jgi:hypothetical protein
MWLPMAQAPRDGTPIVALYNDFSGGMIVAFSQKQNMWLVCCGLQDGRPFWGAAGLSDAGFSGWIAAPDELCKICADWPLPEDVPE